MVASRTIWYVQTDDVFMASTSQRAIVYFLHEFQPDKTAFLWMLSSGTLGPDASWDSRVKRLGPNARLILDRSMWRLRVERENIGFDPSIRHGWKVPLRIPSTGFSRTPENGFFCYPVVMTAAGFS